MTGQRRTDIVVLLAEDEALIALSLADLLEAEGCQVTVTSDGIQALNMARRLSDALEVLVTDLHMPNMGGEDLIRALRAERPGLPVIVVTGSPPPGGVADLRRHGGGHGPLTLLHKPVDYEDLVVAVSNASEYRSGPPAP